MLLVVLLVYSIIPLGISWLLATLLSKLLRYLTKGAWGLWELWFWAILLVFVALPSFVSYDIDVKSGGEGWVFMVGFGLTMVYSAAYVVGLLIWFIVKMVLWVWPPQANDAPAGAQGSRP